MAAGLVSSLLVSLGKLIDLLPNPAAALWPSRGGRPTVSDDLRRLQRLLLRVHATLEDAGAREVRDSSVKLWLEELRGLARDAEDVLDDHRHDLLRRRAQEWQGAAGSRKRKRDDGADEDDGRMSERIGEITRRFEEISRDRAALQLRPDDGERIPGVDSIWESRTSSHLLDESLVFGRTEEKEHIIELVLSCSQRNGIQVLPIVGMGGIGKTTMAQMVYNDSRVRESFHLRGWVHVSQIFDVHRLTIAITESLTRKPCGFNELSDVHRVLKKKVGAKEFDRNFPEEAKSVFLVLDDVWNERKSLWQDLLCPLMFAKTVTMLVTTRSKEVARLVQTQTVSPFAVGSLPEDHCWLLFQRYAFGDRIIDEESSLVHIGRKIMQKCGGLPLAVKSIGCLLRSKMDLPTWIEISESEFWEYSDDNEEVFSALRLSFHRLPTKLKPCFLMCTSCPKGHSFTKDDMIHLWIAHGYIQPERGKIPEKVAGEYFDELNERSLIEIDLDLCNDHRFLERRSSVEISSEKLLNTDQNIDEWHVRSLVETFGERKTEAPSDQSPLPFQGFRLHDIVWDLAKSLSNHVLSATSEDDSILNGSNNVQHLFLFLGMGRYMQNSLSARHVMNRLRSLEQSGQTTEWFDFIEKPGKQEYCIAKECNHSLIVQNRVSQLHKMSYLRTLLLKCCNCELPIDIQRFTYLRALVLDSCKDRGCISAIRNLKHLRYLQVTNCYCNNLKNLMESNCGSIRELPLFIGNLRNLRCLQLDQISNIKQFNHDSFRCQTNNNNGQEVIFPALEDLQFDGLCDLQDWCGVQDSDCPKIQSITIRNCSKLRRIPYFGSVRKLTISKLVLTDLQLATNDAPSQLQILDIRDCQNLASLIGLKYLCCLGSLYITHCPELSVSYEEKLPYKPQHVFVDDCLLLKNWCDEQELYYQTDLGARHVHRLKCSESSLAVAAEVMVWLSKTFLFRRFQEIQRISSSDVCPEKGPEVVLTPNSWLSSDLRFLKFGFESSCGGSFFQGGFSTLRRLEIRGCPKLAALMGLEELGVLRSLVIEDCPSLYILPEMKFPPHLSSLIVQGCHKLLSLQLNTSDPSTFIELEVCDCKGLMYIGNMACLSNLESLVLLHCPLLELKELLPRIPESVTVFLCPKLKKWCEIQSIEYQKRCLTFRVKWRFEYAQESSESSWRGAGSHEETHRKCT
ncbi:hypothetical protein ACP70R_007592 [Stipagrostis hirtigluma subsp. patula]